MRRAGVLLHVTSLPGEGPAGTMGADARRFVDFLQGAGQSVWQLLPLTPPADHHSPYSSYSVFAGNPLLIDIPLLEEDGLLPKGVSSILPKGEPGRADFAACERAITTLLAEAYGNGWERDAQEVAAFRAEQSFWIEDYALYMAIRYKQGDISYHDWPPLLCVREKREMEHHKRLMGKQIDFWVYVQYLFFGQWRALKRYANERGIKIVGDMPIYTASGSADVWANSEVFLVNHRHRPLLVAGVPPDAFSEDGQRWGNPLYNWEYLKSTGYRWWIERLRTASLLYDEVRIDHFRALDEYYAIPASHTDARGGTWEKGPGMDFFRAVNEALPGCKLIAEDLGSRTDSVIELLESSGLAGMSVMLFAFHPGENSDYLPHNHKPNSVAYIGTHDNDTAVGWLQSAPQEETAYAREYLELDDAEPHWGFIEALYGSAADTVVVQMQDLLGLGSEARMNTPATVGGNWEWRLTEKQLAEAPRERLLELARKTGRI